MTIVILTLFTVSIEFKRSFGTKADRQLGCMKEEEEMKKHK